MNARPKIAALCLPTFLALLAAACGGAATVTMADRHLRRQNFPMGV